MAKIAFLCPGQGAETTGMGVDFVGRAPWAADFFEEAKATTGLDIFELCNSPQEELSRTENAQPCLAVASIAAARALQDRGIEPDCVAGYSCGEYAAHVIAGTADAETVLELLARRAAVMAMACHMNPGASAVLLDCDADQAEALCKKHAEATGKVLAVSGFECPGQIAIAGAVEALDAALEDWRASGGKASKSTVDGALHTSLMSSAAFNMRMALKHTLFGPGDIPLYCNVNAQVFDCKKSPELLEEQIVKPVLWQQIVEAMLEDGVDTFIQCGPGSELLNSVKRIASAKGVAVKTLAAGSVTDVATLAL